MRSIDEVQAEYYKMTQELEEERRQADLAEVTKHLADASATRKRRQIVNGVDPLLSKVTPPTPTGIQKMSTDLPTSNVAPDKFRGQVMSSLPSNSSGSAIKNLLMNDNTTVKPSMLLPEKQDQMTLAKGSQILAGENLTKRALLFGSGMKKVNEGYQIKMENNGVGGEDLIAAGNHLMEQNKEVLNYAHKLGDADGAWGKAYEWGKALVDPNFWKVNQSLSMPSNASIMKYQLGAGITAKALDLTGIGAGAGVAVELAGVTAATHKEAEMEASSVYQELYEEAIAQGLSPKQAHDKAIEPSKEAYWKNIAILAPTNAIQQALIFGLGGKYLVKAVEATKSAEKIAAMHKAIDKAEDIVGPKVAKALKEAGRVGAASVFEAGQEGLQYVASQSSMDKPIDSLEMQENMLSGFGMGGGMTTLGRAVSLPLEKRAEANQSSREVSSRLRDIADNIPAPSEGSSTPFRGTPPASFSSTTPQGTAQEEAGQMPGNISTPEQSSTAPPVDGSDQNDLAVTAQTPTAPVAGSAEEIQNVVQDQVDAGSDRESTWNTLVDMGMENRIPREQFDYLFDDIQNNTSETERWGQPVINPEIQKEDASFTVLDTPEAREDAVYVQGVSEATEGKLLPPDSYQVVDTAGSRVYDVARKLIELTGRKMIVVKPTNEQASVFNGMITNDGIAIILDATSDNPIHSVTMHELVHSMKSTNKNIYQMFRAEVDQVMKGSLMGGVQKWYDDFFKVNIKGKEMKPWQGLSPVEREYYVEEFLANIMQEASTAKTFFRELLDKSVDAARQFLEYIDNIISTLTKMDIDPDYSLKPYIEQWEDVQKVCQRTFVEYVKDTTIKQQKAEAMTKKAEEKARAKQADMEAQKKAEDEAKQADMEAQKKAEDERKAREVPAPEVKDKPKEVIKATKEKVPTPTPKKVGRPKKADTIVEGEVPAPKKRGRPKKEKAPADTPVEKKVPAPKAKTKKASTNPTKGKTAVEKRKEEAEGRTKADAKVEAKEPMANFMKEMLDNKKASKKKKYVESELYEDNDVTDKELAELYVDEFGDDTTPYEPVKVTNKDGSGISLSDMKLSDDDVGRLLMQAIDNGNMDAIDVIKSIQKMKNRKQQDEDKRKLKGDTEYLDTVEDSASYMGQGQKYAPYDYDAGLDYWKTQTIVDEGTGQVTRYWNTDRMSIEEEREMAHRAQAGDTDALVRLVAAYDGLIRKEVSKVIMNPHGRSMGYEEFMQEGRLALIPVILDKRKFNPDRGRLYGIARLHIRGGIQRYLNTVGRTLATPEYKVLLYGYYMRVKSQMADRLGYSPTLDEVIKEMRRNADQGVDSTRDNHVMSNTRIKQIKRFTKADWEDIIESQQMPSSIYQTVGEESDTELLDVIGARDNAGFNNLEVETLLGEVSEQLVGAIQENLTDRQAAVIMLRYFHPDSTLYDDTDRIPFPKVAQMMKDFGVTKDSNGEPTLISAERCRQLEKTALEKLAKSKELEGMGAYLDIRVADSSDKARYSKKKVKELDDINDGIDTVIHGDRIITTKFIDELYGGSYKGKRPSGIGDVLKAILDKLNIVVPDWLSMDKFNSIKTTTASRLKRMTHAQLREHLMYEHIVNRNTPTKNLLAMYQLDDTGLSNLLRSRSIPDASIDVNKVDEETDTKYNNPIALIFSRESIDPPSSEVKWSEVKAVVAPYRTDPAILGSLRDKGVGFIYTYVDNSIDSFREVVDIAGDLSGAKFSRKVLKDNEETKKESKKQTAFAKRAAPLFSEEFDAEMMADQGSLEYNEAHMDDWKKFASDTIGLGFSKAVRIFNKKSLQPGQKTVLGYYLASALEKESVRHYKKGNTNSSIKYHAMAKDVLLRTSIHLTEAGQEVSSAKVVKGYTTSSMLSSAQRIVNKEWEDNVPVGLKNEVSDMAKKASEGLQKINEDAMVRLVDSIAKDSNIQEVVQNVTKKRNKKNPPKERVDTLIRNIENHVSNVEGNTPVKQVVKNMNDLFNAMFGKKAAKRNTPDIANDGMALNVVRRLLNGDPIVTDLWHQNIAPQLRHEYGEIFNDPQEFFTYYLTRSGEDNKVNKNINTILKTLMSDGVIPSYNNIISENDINKVVNKVMITFRPAMRPTIYARVKYLINKNKEHAAETTAKRIMKMASPPKDTDTRTENKMRDMMNMVVRLARETLPRNTKVPRDPMELVANALHDYGDYQKMWMKIEQRIVEKYGDSHPDEIELLQQFFNRPINDVISNKTLERIVQRGLKSEDMTLGELVKKHYSEQSLTIETLADRLVEEFGEKHADSDAFGITPEDAQKLSMMIERKFEELVHDKKQVMLEKLFKRDVKPRAKQTLIDRLITYSNLGAFSQDEYTNIIAEKLGLPSMSQETAATISDLCDSIQTCRYTSELSKDGEYEIQWSNTYKYRLMDKYGRNIGDFNTLDEAKNKIPEVEWSDIQREVGREVYDEKVMELHYVLSSLKYIGFWRKVATTQTISMLLNMQTMMRNIFGNEIVYITKGRISKLPAVAIDVARSKLTGNDRTITFKHNNSLASYIDGTKFGISAAWKGYTPRGLEGQYELGFAPSFKSDGGFVERGFSFLERCMRATLLGLDQASVTRAYDDKLSELAALQCINNDEKVTKDRIDHYMGVMDENMKDIALDYAKIMTFQNDNTLTRAGSGLKRALNVNQEFGVGDVIMKFTKVPANLTLLALELSPFGFLRGLAILTQHYRSEKAFGGPKDIQKTIEAFSEALVGTFGFTAFGVLMGMTGVMTGTEPEDPREKYYQRSQGKGLYKFNITAFGRWMKRFATTGNVMKPVDWKDGDWVVGYSWAEPAATSMAIGVSFSKSYKAEKAENPGTNAAGLAIAALDLKIIKEGVGTIWDRSIFEGINSLFETEPGKNLDGGQIVTNIVTEFTVNAPASFIPSVLRQARVYTDPYARITWEGNVWQQSEAKLKDKLPGLSKTLPSQQDYFGNKMKKNVGMEDHPVTRMASSLVLPMYMNQAKTPDVGASSKIIEDIYKQASSGKWKLPEAYKAGSALPGAPQQTMTIDGTKIKLTDKEYRYMRKLRGAIIDEMVQESSTLGDPSVNLGYKLKELQDIYKKAGEQTREVLRPAILARVNK